MSTTQIYRELYNLEHSSCPSCSSDWSFETTCIGMAMDDPKTFRDTNEVHCTKCGWSGIRHDMKPVKKEGE